MVLKIKIKYYFMRRENFIEAEYMSITNLAVFFEKENSDLEKLDPNLEKLISFIGEEKELVSDKKKLMYDIILKELPYYWLFLQDEFRKTIKGNEFKAIVDDMPEQGGKGLSVLLRNKLIALLNIDEDLLQSCIFHYSKLKENGMAIEKNNIFDVYKKVYIEDKNFNLKDIDLVVSAYKKELE
jgi:hypothetical protein